MDKLLTKLKEMIGNGEDASLIAESFTSEENLTSLQGMFNEAVEFSTATKVLAIEESLKSKYEKELKESEESLKEFYSELSKKHLKRAVVEWCKMNHEALHEMTMGKINDEILGHIREAFDKAGIILPASESKSLDEYVAPLEKELEEALSNNESLARQNEKLEKDLTLRDVLESKSNLSEVTKSKIKALFEHTTGLKTKESITTFVESCMSITFNESKEEDKKSLTESKTSVKEKEDVSTTHTTSGLNKKAQTVQQKSVLLEHANHVQPRTFFAK